MNYLFPIVFPLLNLLLLSEKTEENILNQSSIVTSFENISSQPVNLSIRNDISWDDSGGHLQGIQLYEEKGENFAYLSGSSSSKAYMVKARIDSPAQVMDILELMSNPYRHAGGFQIFKNFLAVGVEDNYAKTTSKIMIYDISEANSSPWADPLYIIERNGSVEQKTAGAVGIAEFQNKIWVAVANWDSRNIDFYSCDSKAFYTGKAIFDKSASFAASKMDKQDWSDKDWHSYQNINLALDRNDGLYMTALTKDNEGYNRVDLFAIKFSNIPHQGTSLFEKYPAEVSLRKISSKVFDTKNKTDFRAGSGFHLTTEGSWSIVSCPSKLGKETIIQLFLESKP